MHEIAPDTRDAEIQRLLNLLTRDLRDAERLPEILRQISNELERTSAARKRYAAELYHNEQVARIEADQTLRAVAATEERFKASEAANRAKDRFLAVLSHELRTPLQPVLATASALLRDKRLPPDLLDDVRTIQRNVQLEARLIDDLLDLTKITSGKLGLTRTAVNIESVIARSVDICEPEIIAKRLHFSVSTERATRKWVHADPGRMQQILWNLIKNAVKFTPAGGTISVTAQSGADDRLMVQVIDSGIGMEPDVLVKIFDAFEQGQPEITQRFGGLGLGLSISKVLAEAHDGTLSADSAGRDQGSTFTLTLPTVEGPLPADANSQRAMPPRPPARSLRVLFVEDDRDTARVMVALLRTLGHQTIAAEDFASGLREAANGEFHLLISDVSLPDGSGLDLMAKLKSTRAIKGIALTGYGTEDDIRRTLEAGFSCHLTKPITLEQLVRAMDSLFP